MPKYRPMWKCPKNAHRVTSLNGKAYSLSEERASPLGHQSIRLIYFIMISLALVVVVATPWTNGPKEQTHTLSQLRCT